MSEPPTPHSVIAATAATAPIAPNIRWPVKSINIIDENINRPINSYCIKV